MCLNATIENVASHPSILKLPDFEILFFELPNHFLHFSWLLGKSVPKLLVTYGSTYLPSRFKHFPTLKANIMLTAIVRERHPSTLNSNCYFMCWFHILAPLVQCSWRSYSTRAKLKWSGHLHMRNLDKHQVESYACSMTMQRFLLDVCQDSYTDECFQWLCTTSA